MKDKVSILLAVYKPNTIFLKKQLESLNNQTHENTKIFILDDSEDENEYEAICNIVKSTLKSKEYEIKRNEKNLGSNRTFERLTLESEGDFFAYCDQDDIWEKDKISKLIDLIKKENSVLCYSDLSVIDKNDRLLAKSFKDIHKRLKHLCGENLFNFFLSRNSVTGCTMVIKSDIAKEAVPFCNDYFVHDHWLALFASTRGRISYIKEPLIKYRIHGNNQIGSSMLRGIENREDYLNDKLFKERNKYRHLLNNYDFNKTQKKQILIKQAWIEQRIKFFQNRSIRNTAEIIRNVKDDWQLVIFELIINFAPEILVKKLLGKIKH